MKTFHRAVCLAFAAVALAACAPVETKPEIVCASTPVVTHTTDVRYVPIRNDLTRPQEDPAPDPMATVGDALKAAKARFLALQAGNARFAQIRSVQGRSVGSAEDMGPPNGSNPADSGGTQPAQGGGR